MKARNLPLKHYINRMVHKRYFSFVRYGDGEWKALTKEKRQNGRAQWISAKLHNRMNRSFLDCPKNGIYFGLQANIIRNPDLAQKYLRKHHLKIAWVDADVFHHASRDGVLFPLIRQLRKMRVVIIGPDFLRRRSKKIVKYKKFISVPPTNAYGSYQSIIDEIRLAHNKLGDGVVYSFSTGPTSEMVIQDLFPEIPKNFLIDFGSLWDIFCGHRSRGYHRTIDYSVAKIHRNLGLRG